MAADVVGLIYEPVGARPLKRAAHLDAGRPRKLTAISRKALSVEIRTLGELAPLLGEVVVEIANLTGRVARDDRAWWHVVYHHAPGGDDRFVTDGHAGQDQGSGADEYPPPDADAPDPGAVEVAFGARVVRQQVCFGCDRRLVADLDQPRHRTVNHGIRVD